MKKLKINLYGESVIIEKLLVDKDLNKLTTYNADDFDEAMQAYPFLDIIDNIERKIVLQALLDTYKSQIEIWFSGKKVLKFKMAELNRNSLLFPIYKCSHQSIPVDLNGGIYCKIFGIGLIASYETFIEDFNIDKLIFQTSSIENQLVLSGLKYDETLLQSIKSDALTTRKFYFRTDIDNG